ncbi:MAG: PfkB family carbohydrate kinase, partial [Clostridia bacterium]|nr:PfkB family carbohydrate kinase [Clostridia bacterium]
VGAVVSFDVNLRKHLWKDDDALRRVVIDFLPYADIVKVTDDELEFVSGKSDIVDGVKDLLDIAVNAKIVFVTKGEKGSSTFDRELHCIDTPAYVSENGVVDTTGAGDCFIGSIIYKLLKNETDLTINRISNAVDFASKACACVISKKGAMNAMPNLDDIEKITV